MFGLVELVCIGEGVGCLVSVSVLNLGDLLFEPFCWGIYLLCGFWGKADF